MIISGGTKINNIIPFPDGSKYSRILKSDQPIKNTNGSTWHKPSLTTYLLGSKYQIWGSTLYDAFGLAVVWVEKNADSIIARYRASFAKVVFRS